MSENHKRATEVKPRHLLWALAVVLVLAAPTARGAYVLSVESLTGGSSLTVDPGESFTLNVPLSSDSSDQSFTATFDVIFSEAGLEYESYTWVSPYTTGGTDDASVPSLSGGILSASTYLWGDADAADIHLDSLVKPGTFGEGILAQLTLAVPSDWTGGEAISIWTDPGGFGLPIVPTTAGPAFTLTTTPEPATAILALVSLASGGSYAARRRKKARP